MGEIDYAVIGMWFLVLLLSGGLVGLGWKIKQISTLRAQHILELDSIFDMTNLSISDHQKQIYAQANEHNSIFAELRSQANLLHTLQSQLSTAQFRIFELENECESLRRAVTATEQ